MEPTQEINYMPKYLTIEELIHLIDPPHNKSCYKILTENRKLFETVQGSTHNHQAWAGGIIDMS